MFLSSVWNAFGIEIDYAQVVKLYESDSEGEKYSPPAAPAWRNIASSGSLKRRT